MFSPLHIVTSFVNECGEGKKKIVKKKQNAEYILKNQ